MAEGNGFIIPIDAFATGVEGVVTTHEEEREVPSRAPDVVDVFQTDAWLTHNEGVCWRWNQAARHPRLEVCDRGNREEDVVAPPGYDWIALDYLVSPTPEELQK